MPTTGAVDPAVPPAPRVYRVWVWSRWTRLPLSGVVVSVALATVVVDICTAWTHVSLGHLGRVPISPALPLGLLLAWLVGPRHLGLDRPNRAAWGPFLVVTGVALVFALVAYGTRLGGWREGIGLAIAALGEELVYRLAVLAVVGAASAWLLGRNWRNASEWGAAPGAAALLGTGLVFTLAPGHVAQMSDTLQALPFACLGMVLGYAVLRTGALFPAAVVHALVNLATIAALVGTVSFAWRTALAGTALIALVLGTVAAGLRLGLLRKVRVESPWSLRVVPEPVDAGV